MVAGDNKAKTVELCGFAAYILDRTAQPQFLASNTHIVRSNFNPRDYFYHGQWAKAYKAARNFDCLQRSKVLERTASGLKRLT